MGIDERFNAAGLMEYTEVPGKTEAQALSENVQNRFSTFDVIEFQVSK
jgi:hypothetical protein